MWCQMFIWNQSKEKYTTFLSWPAQKKCGKLMLQSYRLNLWKWDVLFTHFQLMNPEFYHLVYYLNYYKSRLTYCLELQKYVSILLRYAWLKAPDLIVHWLMVSLIRRYFDSRPSVFLGLLYYSCMHLVYGSAIWLWIHIF